jgi:hypothetical protein
MAKEHLFFDKTEITAAVLSSNPPHVANLQASRISSIIIKPFEEKVAFGKKPSERIEIFVRGNSEPIVYTKLKEKEFWERYKTGLKKFAKDNRITFTDETS